MSVADTFVVAGSILAIAGLVWFFFAPRKAHVAELSGGVQQVEVTVRGGYHPDVIRVRQGVPLELVFDRQESGDCTSRVVFGEFALSAALPAYERTTVRLTLISWPRLAAILPLNQLRRSPSLQMPRRSPRC